LKTLTQLKNPFQNSSSKSLLRHIQEAPVTVKFASKPTAQNLLGKKSTPVPRNTYRWNYLAKNLRLSPAPLTPGIALDWEEAMPMLRNTYPWDRFGKILRYA
jgi:hypothetical protein